MPARFASGKYTNKFDVETPTETVERVDRTMDNMVDQQDEFQGRVDRDIQDLRRSSMRHAEQLGMVIAQLDEQRRLHELFLRSTVVRFLNFFGQWFIYGTDGHVYANTLKNLQYGPAPLLTRIGRALNDVISGIVNAFRPKEKNHESGDSEEGKHLLPADNGSAGSDGSSGQVQ